MMELSNEAEKQLSESLQKCRCCFRMLIDDRRAVNITEEHRNQFFELTNIELLISEIFADRICQLCVSDLKVFSNLRDDLRSKQKDLYQLAGIEDFENVNEKEEVAEDTEMVEDDGDTSQDFDLNFETIDAELYTEQEQEQEEFVNEELDEAVSELITVEKVEVKAEDSVLMETDSASGCFDFFEEIVESDDQKFSFDMEKIKDEIISCDICGIDVQKNHLIQHIQVMHKSHGCTQCNKKFLSKISLKRHVAEAHFSEKTRSKKRHYCPLCPKDYDYKKQLEDHIRSFHDRERNSTCHICHKSFYHRDLKKHIYHVHGDKNIACELCGKLYTCVENLRLHMRYHQEPSYVCSHADCGKKFHQKVLWEHHEKKHTDVKPVICDVCNASFYSVRDMKRHSQRVHDKVNRKCLLCDTVFSRKDKYRLHLIRKHVELSTEERESILEQVRNMKWNEV